MAWTITTQFYSRHSNWVISKRPRRFGSSEFRKFREPPSLRGGDLPPHPPAHVHLSPNNGVPEPPEPVCAFLRGVTPPCVKSRLRTNFTRKSMKNHAKWSNSEVLGWSGRQVMGKLLFRSPPSQNAHGVGGNPCTHEEGEASKMHKHFGTFWGNPPLVCIT